MATAREWTGSVAVLPESMREFALQMQALANSGAGAGALVRFLDDHAWTLSEWADAVEQLYARLDEGTGEGISNAQGVALARFLRQQGARGARVMLGTFGLPDDYLSVVPIYGPNAQGGIVDAGIAPDGAVST